MKKSEYIAESRTVKSRKSKLTLKLCALFFIVIFGIALINLLLHAHLLSLLEKENDILNKEQIQTSAEKLNAALSEVQSSYASVMQQEVFSTYTGLTPSRYTLHKMYWGARESFSDNSYISHWTIFLRKNGIVVDFTSVQTEKEFFSSLASKSYPVDFWELAFEKQFSTEYYPVVLPEPDSGNNEAFRDSELLPVAMKYYWKDHIVTFFLIDMKVICQTVGPYIEESSYLFSKEGTLLYCSDPELMLTEEPQSNRITAGDGSYLVYKAACSQSGIQYVKLIPESQAMSLSRSSLKLYLMVTLLSLATAAILIAASLRRTLHPINNMLNLLQQHSELEDSGDIHHAHSVLQRLLQQREEQASALAQQDEALSEYFFSAQLKNVYVDMKQPAQADTAAAYILYIEVRYRQNVQPLFSMTLPELERNLREKLSAELNRFFSTTLIFQLESSCYIAKVTLKQQETSIEAYMREFMSRLEQESYAYFTVVQGGMLQPEDHLPEVYTAVLEAARQAIVCERTQLLYTREPSPSTVFSFTRQEEQHLYACMCSGQTDAAAEFAGSILKANVQKGITYSQLEQLSILLVNTVAGAVSVSDSKAGQNIDSNIFNTIITRCSNVQDYHTAVLDFILSFKKEDPDEEEDPILLKVQQYLADNFQRDFSAGEMADALNISRSYLSSYYKAKTGNNLSDSIQYFRIQMAMGFIKNPNIKISEIGAMVGIYNVNTFTRQFRKYTGMSPKEYRDTNL